MTDRGANKLNQLLIQLTGVSIRSHGTTLGALTDGNMPDFKVMKVAVAVNNQVKERRMFIVSSVIDYICARLKKLFDNDLFLPSSVNTKLSDNTVIIRLGVTKGASRCSLNLGSV